MGASKPHCCVRVVQRHRSLHKSAEEAIETLYLAIPAWGKKAEKLLHLYSPYVTWKTVLWYLENTWKQLVASFPSSCWNLSVAPNLVAGEGRGTLATWHAVHGFYCSGEVGMVAGKSGRTDVIIDPEALTGYKWEALLSPSKETWTSLHFLSCSLEVFFLFPFFEFWILSRCV